MTVTATSPGSPQRVIATRGIERPACGNALHHGPQIVLNSIVAESLDFMATRLEAARCIGAIGPDARAALNALAEARPRRHSVMGWIVPAIAAQ